MPERSSEIGTRLARSFAHNDYAQDRPLLDALAHGFAAIEADVHLVEGELLVGHSRSDLVPGRTLASTYLEPLAALVGATGRIYPDHPLVLLVDVKTHGEPAWPVLRDELAAYAPMLVRHDAGGSTAGPVSVVVSGHVDLAAMEADPVRHASADGRIQDLPGGLSPVVTMVSAKWSHLFRWRGFWRMRRRERDRLHALVSEVHRAGRQIRFWGTTPRMWPELVAADVDLVIADDLSGMAAWFARNGHG
jgi:hypothetical protein